MNLVNADRASADNWLTIGSVPTLLVAHSFHELGRAMFTNVAPIVPDAALTAIGNVLQGADDEMLRRCGTFAPLLRSIAGRVGKH